MYKNGDSFAKCWAMKKCELTENEIRDVEDV